MRDAAFLQAVQGRTARMSVTSSSARGQGAGTVEAGREYLASVDLRAFGTSGAHDFGRRLDEQTEELQGTLPTETAAWGTARKLLNIFLRESLYTVYLAEAFDLQKAEFLLELPLDSITTDHLRGCEPSLPPFPGVKHLDRGLSDEYQRVAGAEARIRGWARVHLDALWWGQRPASRRLTMR